MRTLNKDNAVAEYFASNGGQLPADEVVALLEMLGVKHGCTAEEIAKEIGGCGHWAFLLQQL